MGGGRLVRPVRNQAVHEHDALAWVDAITLADGRPLAHPQYVDLLTGVLHP